MIEQETKTSTKSRIVTWIIAVVMIGGIFSSFIVLIISSNNQQKDSKTFEEAQARLTEIDEEYQTTVTKLSNEHYSTFSKYSSQVKAYNAAAVTSLVKEDLVIGTGEEITSNTPYNAYYIGWLADGTVFDSSINGETLKDPISGGNLIQGWNEGVIGMKIGGVRVITMPPEMGYGDQVSGQIPANSPLKFLIMTISPVNHVWPDDAVSVCAQVYSGQIGDEATTEAICQQSYGNSI